MTPTALAPAVPAPAALHLTVSAAQTAASTAWRGQVAGFLLVGAVTTVVYLLLYVLLQPALGAQVANLLALALTVDANTLANRQFSFGVHGEGGRVREHVQAWVAFAFCLVLSSGSLVALEALGVTSGAAHLTVLVVAEAVAGAVHFALLRWWVFAGRS